MVLRASSTRKPDEEKPQPGNGLRLLTAGGLLSLVLYVGFYLLMLAKSLWESPTLVPDKWKTIFRPIRDLFPRDWVWARKGTEPALSHHLLYLLLIVALFAVYFFVIVRLWKGASLGSHSGRGALRRILFFTVLFLAVLFVVHGALSSDLFSYVSYGRIFAIYGDNPLVNAPADYAWSDRAKWIQWVYWKETPSVYGPVWLWLAAGIAKVAQAIDNDLVTHLLGHKLLASLAHLLNVVLVWKVAGLALRKYPALLGATARSKPDSDNRLAALRIAATVTYAWNPLVVLEFGANGHNDVLLVTFVLAALWMHLKGMWRLAALCLAAAVLVKLIAVVLVPGYLWLLFWQGRTEKPAWDRDSWRAGFSRAAQAALIVSAALVVAYWPFWTGPEILRSLAGGPPATRMVNSLSDVLRNKGAEWLSDFAHSQHWYPYKFWEPGEIAARLDWPLRWGSLMIAAAWAVLRTWGARTFPDMVRAWGWVLLIYLVIGSVWYWPWYASWLLVPAILAGSSRLLKATLVLSASSMLLYAIFPVLAQPFDELPGWSGLVIMGPPLGYLLGVWILDAITRRRARRVTEPTPLPAPAGGLATVAVPVPLRPEPLFSASSQEHSVAADLPTYIVAAQQESYEIF